MLVGGKVCYCNMLAQSDKLDIIVKYNQITSKSPECVSNKPGSLKTHTVLSQVYYHLFPRAELGSERHCGTLIEEADADELMPLLPLEQPRWPYLRAVDLHCRGTEATALKSTLLLTHTHQQTLKYFVDVSSAQGIKLIV